MPNKRGNYTQMASDNGGRSGPETRIIVTVAILVVIGWITRFFLLMTVAHSAMRKLIYMSSIDIGISLEINFVPIFSKAYTKFRLF